MKPKLAQKILKETENVFNKIANEFSITRKYPWQIFHFFSNYVKDGDKILDIGCGNGRLVEVLKNKKIKYVGIDIAKKLIELAEKRFQEIGFKDYKLLIANALNLPFENSEFDKVFMIAVLPHLPSKEIQMKALKEVYRVLKFDGYFFLVCWNLWQPKIFLKNILERIKNFKNYLGLGFKDFLIPWKTKNGKVFRYYYGFFKNELKKLLEETGFYIEDIYFEKNGKRTNFLKGFNIVVIAKKMKK
jgi:ubiquinone/menaquinone biosynthesis C-methylase UbiE